MRPAVVAATSHNKSVGAKLQLLCDFLERLCLGMEKIS